MTCTICDKYKAKITAAMRAADGKPAGAPEYKVALDLMSDYHLHYDVVHRAGGRFVQPAITEPLVIDYGDGHRGTRHINTCGICGVRFVGKANTPTCGRDACRDAHRRKVAKRYNERRRVMRAERMVAA